MKKLLLLFSLFTFCFSLFTALQAQNPDLKRTWHWYFGHGAGLDFSNGAPVAVTNNILSIQFGGMSAISDTSGQLLFYTDGNTTVVNRNHQPMPNGSNICNCIHGDFSSNQKPIIPLPGNNNIYYIFTAQYTGPYDGMMMYAIVDMAADGGLGDVVSAQNPVLHHHATTRLAAVKHSNNIDWWIITNKYQTDSFFVYLLTAGGLDTVPVISKAGHFDNGGGGEIVSSPDGKLLAETFDCIAMPNFPQLFHFNNTTGVITGPIVSFFASSECITMGTQISPDAKKLYFVYQCWVCPVPCISKNAVYQYDISVLDSASIINSRTLLDTLFIVQQDTSVPAQNFVMNFSVALQQASDGKIYGDKNSTGKVSSIQNPNLPGLACNYTDSAVYLNGRYCGAGLIYFPASFFYINDSVFVGNFEQEPGIENGEKIRIYPNPFNVSATIEINEKQFTKAELTIYNILGYVVYKSQIPPCLPAGRNPKFQINRNNLSQGMYLLKIKTQNNLYTKKLIITN